MLRAFFFFIQPLPPSPDSCTEPYSYSLSPGLLFLQPAVTYLIIDLGKSSLFRLTAVRRHKMSQRYSVLTHEENVHMVTRVGGGGEKKTYNKPLSVTLNRMHKTSIANHLFPNSR